MDEAQFQLLKEMVAQGKGRVKIAAALGIGHTTASRWIQRAKALMLGESRKKEQVQELVSQGATPIEVARAIHSPISAASNWIGKVDGSNEPVDKQIKMELAKGTSLYKMMNKFGVSGVEEVRELIDDCFDPATVMRYEKATPDGDTTFVLIPDSDEFSWLDVERPKPKFRYHVNPANNYMFIKFDDDLPDEIKVFNFTDLHIGSSFCRTELLKQHIKMVAEDPAAFSVLGGDIFDYMHKMSVGQPWEQKLSPMQQVTCAARMLMPLAHKNLRYVGGNHDHGRGYKPVGADLAEVLSKLLRTSYGVMETVIDMEFKGHLFTAILHHGAGRGNSIQGILSDAEKYRRSASYFANWHLSGHVHQSFVLPRYAVKKIEGQGLVSQRFFTVVGGSYMKRTGSYAEETKYDVCPQDLTYITMRADGSYNAGPIEIEPV